jgi:hypothetical protein
MSADFLNDMDCGYSEFDKFCVKPVNNLNYTGMTNDHRGCLTAHNKAGLFMWSSLNRYLPLYMKAGREKLIDFSLTSSSGNEFILNEPRVFGDDFIAWDDNFYYLAKLQGRFATEPTDNDQSVNLASAPNNTITVKLQANYNGDGVTYVDLVTKTFTYSSGGTITLDADLIFEATNHFKFRLLYSHPLGSGATEIKPIDNYSDYWCSLKLYRLLKTAWINRFTVTPIPKINEDQHDINIPYTARLPFPGYYAVKAFVVVAEFEANGVTPVNTNSAHTMQFWHNGAWLTVDSSPVFNPSGTGVTSKMFNTSLQGCAAVLIDDASAADRDLTMRITLPNGFLTEIIGGWVEFRYLGEFFSPVLI